MVCGYFAGRGSRLERYWERLIQNLLPVLQKLNICCSHQRDFQLLVTLSSVWAPWYRALLCFVCRAIVRIKYSQTETLDLDAGNVLSKKTTTNYISKATPRCGRMLASKAMMKIWVCVSYTDFHS